MHVDYDRRQHAVYARARRPSREVLDLWTGIFARYIPAGDAATLVDVGSGVGTWSQLLATAFRATVWAVDPSEKMRAVAAREHPHPRVHQLAGSGERIPLPDGACDGALLSYVLHHLVDPVACAAELRRVLRPGAPVIIRTTLRESLDRAPFFEYFPTAWAIDAERMPARDDVIGTFGGFELVAEEVVEQDAAPSLQGYYRRLALRAISTLELLPDDEFAAGLERLRRAAAAEREPRPVVTPVDLLVFRRAP